MFVCCCCFSTVAQIADLLGLDGIRDRTWQIQPCSAKTGEGLEEGITWVVDKVQSKKDTKDKDKAKKK